MGENGAAGRSDKTILVVDDTGENLTVIGGLLQPFFRVRVANSGMRALKVARSDPRPDLILLDVMMPEMDGYAVLAELRQDPYTRDIPVMFVTAMDGDQDEEYRLSLGAVDYITKPIRPAILLARVRTHLELKDARDWLRDQNGYLEGEVSRRMRENDLIKDVSLNALALLAEKRDNETGNHLYRTQAYVEALMQQLQDHPRFRHALSAAQRQLIAKAAPLHDIGKVGIPDQILLKPARLTPEEFEIMKTHSLIGAEAIEAAIERVVGGDRARLDELQGNTPLDFLVVARHIALGHHEKWDGSGYPQGLRGDAIPIPARLMALADVFDALTCKRHYKKAFPLEQAVALLVEGRGTHFDPDVVDAFLAIQDRFADIAQRYADGAS
ncbi:response regulator containing a CheY-like receiver domain and an HD-GYP domain [Azospira oryzae PS]|uniref:Response regulator containing a CheY-like receiver domain and an HD-GYP domain n=1 Tax=Azospira oryzae (strain ATCC BAA-33 / DSM 13638 / PS) TaxID=640081 RepID=G8QIV7_AZOOP|nr:two-component system response regulator [Azospira oryzae]AEV25325.1 response regulator containing a CheY-like receiver domain and an HD-GYP domain [Azospira oryzae PS]